MNQSNKKEIEQPLPYGSAHDLPTFQEMEQLLTDGKRLDQILAAGQTPQIIEVEQELRRLASIVDRFYERLGPRNWIFHDLLNVESIESILNETDNPDDSEQRLIELYQDQETTKSWLIQISSRDGIRQRVHQIERAGKHYNEGEFDSCVLQLIAVMDGFVNDFQPDLRKGLTSRDPEEMAAWDSVVGHHLGLTHALKTFGKTVKKRIDEEVYELFRNGIVHGSVTRFDNVIVAAKAWNMLFAVVDWANATLEFNKPEEPEPTILEIIEQVAEDQHIKEQLESWQAARFALGDSGFEDLEIYQLTEKFLEAWHRGNFGDLAQFDDGYQSTGENRGQLAGEMRELFTSFELTEFDITDIVNSAPVIWQARGSATVNGESGSFECRWMFQDVDGHPAFGSESGEWRLMFCWPSIWTRGD
jgi:hypothetical protein